MMRSFHHHIGQWLNRLAGVVLLVLSVTALSAQVTTNGGSGLAPTYPDLSTAIAALNSVGSATSPTVITVDAANPQTAPAGGYAITATGDATNTITIDGNGNTITAFAGQTTGQLNDAIFKIIGGDHITLRNCVMVENAANTGNTIATNNMTEFGVALFYASATDGPQNCLIENNSITLNRTYVNTFGVYSNVRHTATNMTTIADIGSPDGAQTNLRIIGNTISNVNMGIVVVGNPTAANMSTGVEIGGSTLALGNTISNYGTSGTFTGYIGLPTSALSGILTANLPGAIVRFNNVASSAGGTTAGTLRGIHCATSGTLTFPGTPFTNRISDNTINLSSGVAAGTIEGIRNDFGASVNATVEVTSNNFTGLGHSVAATSSIIGIITPTAAQNLNLSNNTFTNITCNTTGGFTFLSASYSIPGSQTVNNNAIVGAFNKTGAGGTVTLFTNNGSSTAAATSTNSGNNFSNITVTGATTIAGWSNTDGGAVNKTVSNNTFSNWVGGTNAVTAINVNFGGGAGGDGNVVSGNTVSGITSGGAITGINLGGSGTTHTAIGNTVSGLTSSGASAVVGIASALSANIRRNKVCNLEGTNASSTVAGIQVTAGATVNVQNNIVGDLRAPNANAANPVNGINITGGTTVNVDYNTVRLAASSSGALFGSSALSASTTPNLTLRNNILVNVGAPSGAGLNVAYRRSTATLTSYQAASNRNLFFAGAPSAQNLIFSDGTNFLQNLNTNYKPFVAPRDANSVTENPVFASTNCASSDFLHFAPATATFAESAAANIAGITVDFDDQTRQGNTGYAGTGVAPDIGADEFEGSNPSPAGAVALSNVGCATYEINVNVLSVGSSPGGLVDIEIGGNVVATVGVGSFGPFGPYANGSSQTVRILHGSDPSLHVTLSYTTPNISCNDNNPTTNDACVNNACVNTPIPCDDGNPCTGNDVLVLNIVTENFNGVTAPALPAGWTSGGTGAVNNWVTVTDFSTSAPNSVKAIGASAVSDYSLTSPIFNIPASGSQLTFKNKYIFESTTSNFDGGVLEISINGGAFTDIITAGGSFVTGGYTGVLSSTFSNPLGGRSAWTNTNAGSPGFLTTTVNLPAAANGQPIRLRWRFGSDSSTSSTGWWLDDIALELGTTCAGIPFAPSATALTVQACATNEFNIAVTITNMNAATSAVISSDYLGNPGGQTVTAAGTYIIGPFASGSNVVVTIDPGVPGCSTVLGPYTYDCTNFGQNSLDFDGVNDRVSIPHSASVDITGNNLTLEAWIYPTAWRAESWRGSIINKEAPDTKGYMIRCGNNGQLSFNIGVGSTWVERITAQNTLALNTWQHVAATFDGTTMRMFVNGVEVPPATSVGTVAPIASTGPTQNLAIGNWSQTVPERGFVGKIDEVRVWNTALTQPQILAMQNQFYCGDEAGLVAYYRFNQGDAGLNNAGVTTLLDLTANANNGTLQNMALNGPTSNWVEGKTGFAPCAPIVCVVPTGVAAAATSTTAATITWTNNGSASYDWEIRTSGQPGSGPVGRTDFGNVTGSPANSTALSTNTTYTAYVRANCGVDGTSFWSNGAVFNTNVPACVANPTAPANGGTACQGAAVAFSWPAAPNATSYAVFIDGNLVANQAGTTYNAPLSAGPHTWSVVPSNALGGPTSCSEWSFTVIGAPAGDTFGNAVAISSLPFTSSGNNNLEANCFTNTNALRGRDKVWSLLTSVCTTTLTIGLCGDGDSFLYLVEADQSTIIASDDDTEPSGCTNGLSSSLSNVSVSPNTLYYIVMDGFNAATDLTNYTLTVSANCFCAPPAATISGVSENCTAGTFTVGVNVASTGSTGTANVTYTVNGGSPVTVSNVTPGALTLPTSGSFAQGANVYITISTSDNACSSVVGYATDNCPVDFLCENGPVQVINYCYGNGSTKTWTFTQTTSPLETLTLRFISGCFNPGDNLLVYEFQGGQLLGSVDENSQLPLLLTNPNGPSLFLEVNSDASGSCADGACSQAWNFEVLCTPGCTGPSWNAPTVNAACSTIDVSITDLADYNGGNVRLVTTVLPGGTPVSTPVSTIGTYTVGPFTPGQQVQIQLVSQIAGCNDQTQNLGTFTIPALPNVPMVVVAANPTIVCADSSTSLSALVGTGSGNASQFLFQTETGGSLANMSGATQLVATGLDDAQSGITSIGFTFVYEGANYTQFSASSNGRMRLGATAVGTAFTNTGAFLSASLHPLWDDHGTSAGGIVNTVLLGAAPNRIRVVNFDLDISRTGVRGQFQVWLYETSNIIEFRYGSTSAVSASATIAVAGATVANFQAVQNFTTHAAVAGVRSDALTPWPGAGRIYRWGPSGVPASNVIWSPAAQVSNSTIYNPTGTVPATTNFTAQINVNGCPVTRQVTVEVGPALSATINPPVASICGSTPANLTVVANGVPPYTYAWTDPTNTPVGGPNTTSVSAAIGGTWTCVVTDACGSVTATRDVVANPTPVASITPSLPICVGGSVTLTASSTVPGSTFTWSGAAPVGGSIGDQVTINALSPANNGTYSVVATANGCPSAAANYNLVVNSNPVMGPVTATPPSVCNGGSAQLSASATIEGYSVQSIPYQEVTPLVTPINLVVNSTATPSPNPGSLDDGIFQNIPIGFPFTFYGNSYTTVNISTNGNLQFGGGTSTAFAGTTTPNTDLPNNFIGTPFVDMNFNSGNGNNLLRYFSQGTAPNRLFVVEWRAALFNAGGERDTSHAILRENGQIEVHFRSLSSAGSLTTNPFVGVENSAGTIGTAAPGRNGGPWTFPTGNEGWRFTPLSAAITWSNGLAAGSPTTAINIAPPATYIATATNPASGCSSQAPVTVNLNTTDTDGDGVIDCLDNCPNVPGQIGSACTVGAQVGVLDNDCVCQLCTTDLSLDFTMDSGSSMQWEIRVDGSNFLIQSGSTILGPTAFTANTCLPNGCYNLRVTDEQGDGITGGGYVLRLANASGPYTRVIDNRSNYAGVTPSQISGPPVSSNAFCIPLGTDRLIYTSCDKLDWRLSCNGEYVVATDNPAVTAQYNVTNNTSGYEMWWYAPNGGYSFRRVQYHSTTNGLAASATRACHFRPNSWTGNALQQNVLYNVKVRSIVAGTPAPWGPACRFMLSETAAACPSTQLMDIPDNAYLTCGQFRAANSTSALVHARPVRRMNASCAWVNANRYQFRFRIVGEGFNLVKTSATNQYWVNTQGLACGKTYVVDVRASFDNGATWCVAGGTGINDPAWGVSCELFTNPCAPAQGGNQNMAAEGTAAGLKMYPNPNRGDQLLLSLDGIEQGVATVSVDIYDAFGKRAIARTLPVTDDGFVNSVLELNGSLAAGLYTVSITAGERQFNERLVIQP